MNESVVLGDHLHTLLLLFALSLVLIFGWWLERLFGFKIRETVNCCLVRKKGISGTFLNSGTVDILGQVIVLEGAILYIVGFLAASLAAEHSSDVSNTPLLTHYNEKCLQTSPDVPWGAKCPLLRATELVNNSVGHTNASRQIHYFH